MCSTCCPTALVHCWVFWLPNFFERLRETPPPPLPILTGELPAVAEIPGWRPITQPPEIEQPDISITRLYNTTTPGTTTTTASAVTTTRSYFFKAAESVCCGNCLFYLVVDVGATIPFCLEMKEMYCNS